MLLKLKMIVGLSFILGSCTNLFDNTRKTDRRKNQIQVTDCDSPPSNSIKLKLSKTRLNQVGLDPNEQTTFVTEDKSDSGTLCIMEDETYVLVDEDAVSEDRVQLKFYQQSKPIAEINALIKNKDDGAITIGDCDLHPVWNGQENHGNCQWQITNEVSP